MLRLTQNGELDNSSFGDGGVAIYDREDHDEINAVVVQSDDKIVVAGFSATESETSSAIACRFLKNAVEETSSSTSITPATTTTAPGGGGGGGGGGSTPTTVSSTTTTSTPPEPPPQELFTADFTASPDRGNAPLVVAFTGQSDIPDGTYAWDFGDSQTGSGSTVTHTYTQRGTYTVTLTVIGSSGSAAKTKVNVITVTQAAPVADFTAAAVTGNAPFTVSFSDASTGTITDRLWNFGDGQTGAGLNPSHVYTVPGAYTVSLTATGPEGSDTKIKTGFITVTPGVGTFTAAGSISGSAAGGVQVFLTGNMQTSTVSAADGSFAFSGLAPGAYTVTPFKQGVSFTPASRQITVLLGDISGIDFAAAPAGPALASASAIPSIVPADGTTPVVFSVQVGGSGQTGGIASVFIDLSPIGGGPQTPMQLQTTAGSSLSSTGFATPAADVIPGSGIYSVAATVDNGTAPGLKGLVVQAADAAGNTSMTIAQIEVVSVIQDNINPSGTNNYQVLNNLSGQSLTLQYLLGNSMLGKRMSEQNGTGGAILLQIFTPDRKPYLQNAVPITATLSEIRIPNAAQGTWTYQVTNQTASSQSFSLQTTTAGAGIVTGSVLDAATGALLDGVRVASSSGSVTASTQGYYVMIHTAGSFTLTASDAAHAPATRSFTVTAGGSVTLDLMLGAGGGDGSACFLEQTAAPENRISLDVLRAFRDSFLKQSAGGRRLTGLYYKHSPEIAAILARDRRLRNDVWRCILDNLSLIRDINAAGQARLTDRQQERITSLLKRLQTKAGNDLKNAIGEMLQRLETGELISSLQK